MSDPDPRDLAAGALTEAVRLLDRSLAPPQKVRAFQKAGATVVELDPDELRTRVRAGSLTDLPGIGASTGSVIADAVAGRPSQYLARLEESTRIDAGVGTELVSLLLGDCHSHTTWSDGGAPVEEMARSAIALGHEYLVVTDHSARLTVAHGLSTERLRDQLLQIAELNDRLAPFRILTGMEVDILLDGSLDLDDEMLAQLDVVVASVHSKLRMPFEEMTQRMVAAVRSPHVDILGHCTGRKVVGSGRAPSTFDADAVFSACAASNTAIEINCRPERRDPPEELLSSALGHGCEIAINTDAHAPGQLEWQPYGADKAVRCGVPPERIINTRRADELLEWTALAG